MAKKKAGSECLGFDEFWALYPRRVARQDAWKAWQKIKPDDELRGVILAAVRKHSEQEAWHRDEGLYIPHPATWLNGRRWEDEINGATRLGKVGAVTGKYAGRQTKLPEAAAGGMPQQFLFPAEGADP